MRKVTAEKLLAAQASLPSGSRFKIWDAYGSRDVQNNVYQKYWQDIQSQHPDWDEENKIRSWEICNSTISQRKSATACPGGTVDLTIVDSSGVELDMGIEYDFFGPEAEPLFYEIFKNKPEVTANRRMLRIAMEAQGFTLEQDE